MKLLIAFIATIVLAACAYQQPAETFAEFRATLFSYMRADDIRASCQDGSGDRYRFVYNAPVAGQKRSIDVVEAADGSGVLTETIDRGLVFSGSRPINNFADLPSELLAVTRQERLIDGSMLDRLKSAKAADDVFGPPPVGRVLRSRDNWWLVAGCEQGRFFLTGYVLPGNQPDPLQFSLVLRELDPTDVDWPPPQRFVSPRDRSGTCALDNASVEPCYVLTIGEDGLIGHRPLF